MPLDPEQDSTQAQYAAAVAEERAFWKRANDPALPPVERVMAYGAWLAAAQRATSLALKLRQPIPPPT
jgi:hypothetical protein